MAALYRRPRQSSYLLDNQKQNSMVAQLLKQPTMNRTCWVIYIEVFFFKFADLDPAHIVV
jgi:hypothetical protein